MKKLLTLFLVLFAASTLHAKEITVSATDFKAAYDSASNGDVLLLNTGTYGTAIKFPAGKTITLKAAPGQKPVYTAEVTGDTTCTDGGLIFDGVDINRGADYVISANLGNVKIIAMRNLTISNIGRCFLRTDVAAGYSYAIDMIEFTNCIIKDCGTNGWNFMYPKHAVREVITTECTLYNYMQGESFFFANKAEPDNVMKFTFTNNTVYKWAKSNDRAICKTENKYSDGSEYVFTNNIITVPGVAGIKPQIVQTASGFVTATNNLVVDYGGYTYTGAEENLIVADLTLEEFGLTSIGFPDPDNGDFTILSTSPLSNAGIGDPRWYKTLTQPVTLTTKMYPEGAGSVSPIQAAFEKDSTAKVTAAYNYGFRFKEWQDAQGQAVSAENPYSFIISGDIELTAVFTPVNTYTLTVNTDGDGGAWGRTVLTPAPVNGVYEEGTEVKITVVPNSISNFLYWDDSSSESSRNVLMDGNKTVTATFDWLPFLTAWTFDPSEPRSSRPGDFYSRSDNTGIMNFYNGDGSTTNWGGASRTYGGVTYTAARRYTGYADMGNPRYFQAEFSAQQKEQTQYKNIRVISYIAADNACVHKIQKMQYATLPAGPFIDLVSIDMTDRMNTAWIECSAVLPDSVTQAEKVYIRWIGDPQSGYLGTPAATETEGFYLANVTVYADIVEVHDSIAPALLSAIPAAGSTTASANGSIVLTFDKRVKAGVNGGKIEFNGDTLTPVFSNKSISYPYSRLAYGTKYTVAIPEGAVTNMSDVPYAGSSFDFTVMQRPIPALRLYDAVVDINGTGDYTKVQDAIDAAPANRTSPWLIFIKNGRYEELLRIPVTKPYLHFIGEDRENVILTWCIHCGEVPVPGWDGALATSQGVNDACAAFLIDADNFYAENISFENRFGVEAQAGPQALAFKNNRDRLATYNCKFRSYQDTWQTSNGANDRIYANNCWIEGAVDYFYNSGNAYVENSTLYNVRSGSVIVAPSHTADTKWGYVFQNCIVDGNEAAANGNQKLGRPWHNSPKVAYINTTMNIPIHPEGWSDMGTIPEMFAEYNSVDKEGNVIDLSGRKNCFYIDKGQPTEVSKCDVKVVLTAEEAAAYTYENVINAEDNWNPRAFFESVLQPANMAVTDTVLSWDASEYAICYAIYKNGRVTGFTTETSCSLAAADTSDIYSIRPVNEFGSLGEMSEKIRKDGKIVDNVQETPADSYMFQNTGSELIVRNVADNVTVNFYAIGGQLLQTLKAASSEVRIPSAGLKGVYIITVDNTPFKIIL